MARRAGAHLNQSVCSIIFRVAGDVGKRVLTAEVPCNLHTNWDDVFRLSRQERFSASHFSKSPEHTGIPVIIIFIEETDAIDDRIGALGLG